MSTNSLVNGFAGSVLITMDRLKNPDAISVVLGSGTMLLDIVVVRNDDQLVAYLNQCPHTLTTLETFDGRFFDINDPSLLVCSTHGARFRADDGICVAGPCRGKRLTPVPIRIIGNDVCLEPAE